MPTRPTKSSSKGKSTAQPQSNGKPPVPEAAGGRDEVYGLVSFLYHALQGTETYAQYADDARRAGDDEVVEFFEDCRSDEIERSERAKELLAARIDVPNENSAGEDEDQDEDE